MVLRRLQEHEWDLILMDPIRPHISLETRLEEHGEIWIYERDGQPASIACLRWTSQLPADETELFLLTEDEKPRNIAVLYTIWALKKGGAGELLHSLKHALPLRQDRICRQIATLSPPTLIAKNFHLRHGASIRRINPDSVNYQHWEREQ